MSSSALGGSLDHRFLPDAECMGGQWVCASADVVVLDEGESNYYGGTE